MNEVIDFFQKLFDTSDWPPRWHCGNWTDFHGWLYIISDLTIWAAYFAIPILLFLIILKRPNTPFPKVFWLFIAFILLCGSTHLIDAIIFWWPAYRLSALLKFLTALVSFFTVIAMVKILPMAYTLRTSAELEKEIEERKKAEKEVEEQHHIQKQTLELLKNKDDFMSIASHELKTPITSVKVALQFVERKVKDIEGAETILPIIDTASKQVSRLTQIINDLLHVTKLQEGKLHLVKTDFPIIDLINDCIAVLEFNLENHSIEIAGDVTTSVYADYNRLEQVVINLLSNAIKYSPNSSKIIVEILNEKDFVRVSVLDQGIGIAESLIPMVFDRFFRVEDTSQKFSGLGLGLYISAGIVQKHGGKIGVNSEPDKGSTFWFTIPNN
jgi:chemotaxis family two-component system sensor kinase Cph1